MTRVTADAIDLADPALDRADDDALPAGALAGSWRIEHAIATGGYGRVYAARHHVLDGRRAAIKVLHRACAAQPATARRFLDEARGVSRLRHPAIVEVIDVGYLADRRPWIAMELLAEHNLAHRLAAAGALTLDEAIALVAPVAGALDAVHAAGLVHRDVTAHNLGF
ncbi:MAG TPA: protein kinase, partial [Kofleriaceae bacterium]|nr:protein kinase [Kofleriaceae bacterium]